MEKIKLNHDFFETLVLYHALTDEQYLASIADILDYRYFKNKDNQSIISIITDFFQRRGTIPTTTEVKSYLDTDDLKQSFKNVVNSFRGLDKNVNYDELYENTEKFLKEKAVYNTMLEVVDKCTSGEVDTSDILHRFEKACSITLTGDIGLDFFPQIDRHIHDLQHEEKYIPSTWEWLDRKLCGGFLESGRALYVFAGATNVGKSIFLGNIACNMAAQGKTVVLVSLEMSELMYAKRISTNITRIPIGTLHTSSDVVKNRVDQYRMSHPDSKLVIKEFPPNTLTANQLNAYLKKLVHKGIKPDAIILDYINLLHCPVGINSYERIKYASEQVRALSYVYRCPIISATQINRQFLTEANPGVEGISESIGLASTADCIMSIWQEQEDTELGIIRLGMMKNRYGQNFGSCEMSIDYSTLTLTESEPQNNTDEVTEIDETIRALEGS